MLVFGCGIEEMLWLELEQVWTCNMTCTPLSTPLLFIPDASVMKSGVNL
jgi:hypothetical protein